jgi:hypothetical protein
MERCHMCAEEKKHMDAVLATLGPPPEWFSDPIDDDEIVNADDELHSPDRVTIEYLLAFLL